MKHLQKRAKAVSDIYTEAFGLDRDSLSILGKTTEEMGELMGAYLKLNGMSRGSDVDQAELRTDVEKEAADLFGFLMVFAEMEGIDLEAAFEAKWGEYLKDEA